MEEGKIPNGFAERPYKGQGGPATCLDQQMKDLKDQGKAKYIDLTEVNQIPEVGSHSRISAANHPTHPVLKQLKLWTTDSEDAERTAAQRMLFARS